MDHGVEIEVMGVPVNIVNLAEVKSKYICVGGDQVGNVLPLA